ncbi:DUF1127 domain-containing protein [Pseudorhodobacter sp.]|uniref:DUF1127 domain-containing protein n=1 Tax=Pseudorhodobacter sp. TaxID=1934400 RepID=UPI00264788A2|nr:DUF1127 domain-containing protein [Pseudorhodobacter sp.]MDN5788299.1 DUF1127 domain-containing protein [Pseudorhodobacter sp.]
MSVYITRKMIRQAAHDWRQDNTVGIVERMIRSAKRTLKRRETISELHSLTDWELRDIGIYRGDIPRIVRQIDDHDLGLMPASRGAQARGVAVPA